MVLVFSGFTMSLISESILSEVVLKRGTSCGSKEIRKKISLAEVLLARPISREILRGNSFSAQGLKPCRLDFLKPCSQPGIFALHRLGAFVDLISQIVLFEWISHHIVHFPLAGNLACDIEVFRKFKSVLTE